MASESEQLDVSSDSFDPLASIYSSEETVPDPSAPIFNNVEEFVNKYTKPKPLAKTKVFLGPKPGPSTKSASQTTSSLTGGASGVQRRFTSEQMPVKGHRKKAKNFLTFMKSQKEGPMSALARAVETQNRIQVKIRKLDGIRGTCTGVLVAFDKHWNLALVDVDETFNRLRRPRPDIDNDFKDRNRERVGESIVQVLKIRRNTELCQRHISQIVLRGEHVALVQILDSKK